MLANCWKFWKGKILTTNKTFKRSWGLSTGHIPQVKSTIHFSINKLLNHKYSPRSRRAFCKTIGTRRHFWCCLFICVMVTSCTLLTMTWGKWLVFQTHQNTSYNLRDSPRTNLKFDFPTQIISKQFSCYGGTTLRNSLPCEARCAESLGLFKRAISKALQHTAFMDGKQLNS